MFGLDTILFTGRVKITSNPRYELKEGDETTLVIKDVTKQDEGTFTCRVMVKDEVTLAHEVKVTEPFTVKPVSDILQAMNNK